MPDALPADYLHRIYAGVLGKLIGVYLGRPFENWTYGEIQDKLGPINYYVNDRLGLPLVVIDDDVSGTFAFVRALDEHGIDASKPLTPVHVGHTWLNHVIEKRSVFWWGGNGISTEHTAFLNLRRGLIPPRSGSASVNGYTVAEQIGAQIFIDGWALASPGNPALAARLAEGAARCRAVAKQTSKPRITTLRITTNSGNVGCLVAIMHGLEGLGQRGSSPDWRGPLADRALISSADAGYSINNAARITYDIANQARKLAGREGTLEPPKGDAQFHFSLPGSVQGFMAGALSLPSLAEVSQGEIDGVGALKIEFDLRDGAKVDVLTDAFTPLHVLKVDRNYEMMASPLIYPGQNLKAVVSGGDGSGFVLVDLRVKAYDYDDTLFTIDSGHFVVCQLGAEGPVSTPGWWPFPDSQEWTTPLSLRWTIPDSLANKPIQQVGITIAPLNISDAATPCRGTVWLHSLGWEVAAPRMELRRPPQHLATGSFDMWGRAWVGSMDKVHTSLGRPFFMAHDRGEGLLYQGTRDWADYTVAIDNFSIGLAAGPMGAAIRVQGMNRYYALVLREPEPDGEGSSKNWREVAIIKARDTERTVLARQWFDWGLDVAYDLSISAVGSHIGGSISRAGESRPVVEIEALDEAPWTDANYGGEFKSGGAGFVVTGGSVSADCLRITQMSREGV
ncbi:hypothetical protein MAPG_11453 [Magnaporthiopsis poae ATCC 64411]|uniref:Uncharacterized protein n=1 Tax=Magnaporthiopsis poae (strain ATCC 64411 / 73-15) TaxID=644358 RepID=A0A0C4EFB3_MAGP6|nr:hypothetical protein MAPG_11453 [Magnaporthiopsis poae ATCC 64411]